MSHPDSPVSPPVTPDAATLEMAAVEAALHRIRAALAFYAALIRGGEPWTKNCDVSMREAQEAIDLLRSLASPAPESIKTKREGEETAWLIELKGDVPSYWTSEDWDRDVDRAVRFARQQDAQRFIHDFGWTEAVAVEHMWCEPRKHAPAASPVQGVDLGVRLSIGSRLHFLADCIEKGTTVTDFWSLREAASILTATPQSPSTVDERVGAVERQIIDAVIERELAQKSLEDGATKGLATHFMRQRQRAVDQADRKIREFAAALDASREK